MSLPSNKILLSAALLSVAIAITAWCLKVPAAAGGFAIAFFLCMAGFCFRTEKYRSTTYTMVIMTMVTTAMFFPGPFQRVGTFELKTLIVPLLQIIMFTVGSQMSLKDFEGVIRMPRAVVIGLTTHFIIMPMLGFGLAKTLPIASTEIAAGIILIGCVPCGMASNVMCLLAKGNLALSVTLTACATLIAPVLTPFWMKTLAGQYVPIHFWVMMADIIKMVIYPILAGLTFNCAASGLAFKRRGLIQSGAFLILIVLVQLLLAAMEDGGSGLSIASLGLLVGLSLVVPIIAGSLVFSLLHGNRERLSGIMAVFSMTGLATILTIITSAGRDSLLSIGLWLLVGCLLHNLGGYLLGYWSARMFRLDERSCRTVAIEIGQQNGGLASGIAIQLGKVGTLGLAPAIFGALQNVTGSALATWWRRKPVPEDSNN
jgi:BASS family bile acid:Na+ symporter